MEAAHARSGRPVLWFALRVLLAVPVLGVLAALGLALRLSAGPVEIGALAHRLAPAAIDGAPLGFGKVWLGWQGLRHGLDAPLTLVARDIVLRRPGGQAADRIDAMELALALPALLAGRLSVERARIDGASLNLERGMDGALRLQGTAPQNAKIPAGGGRSIRFDRLRSLDIDRLAVGVRDDALGRVWTLDVSGAALRQEAGLVGGHLAARLSADGRSIPLDARSAAIPGGLSWHVSSAPLVPADFSGLLPALAPLSAVALPVTPSVTLRFAAGSRMPRSATLAVSVGAGALSVGGGTLPVASGTATIEATPAGADGVALIVRQARLALAAPDGSGEAAPVFTAGGTVSLDHLAAPRRIRAALTVDSARIGFAGLERYWPARIAPGARRWIVANITAGQATALHVETGLSGDAGWSSLTEAGRTGGFDADGLVMAWLRPMPPLRDMQVHLTFQDTDAVLVACSQATLPVTAVGPAAERLAGGRTLHPLAVSDGSMRITGLDGDDQTGIIKATLTGGLGDLLTELANPRLSLLSRHPVPLTAPSGTARTTLNLSLPLDNNVSIDAIELSARSGMTGVHLGDVAAGLSLDGADLSVSASTRGLSLGGTGSIAGIDSRLHYVMDFTDGGPDQLTEQATVSGTVAPSVLGRLGLDAGDALSGSGALDLAYRARRDGMSTVRLGLDMTGLAIVLPVWRKRAGLAAQLDATVTLDHGALVAVGPIHADGPGLSVEGTVTTPRDGPRRLVVPRFQVGRTRGAGEVVFPRPNRTAQAAPIRISARGASLDLAPIIDAGPARPEKTTNAKTGKGGASGPGPGPGPGHGPGWIADLDFARVYVGQRTELGQATAHLENDGQRLVRARIAALAPTPVALRLEPEPGGRHLVGSVDDAGRLLQGLDVTGMVSGGPLRLDARLDDRRSDSPIAGTVEIGRFVIPDAPLSARIARNVSVYGWLLALPSPQLSIDRLVAPFSLRQGVLTLTDARAHTAALGATMRGRVDLGRRTLDLQGTVVPAWVVNQLPGRLPLVGRLLSPEKGGGVIAATLSIRGPFDDPAVRVNALSALAPGFLRRLLFE